MTERRFAKLKLLEDGDYEGRNTQAAVAVMPWGATKGPMQEAYETLLEQGNEIGWYYTMFVHPLPPKLVEELKGKDLVIVPELNYLGQFSGYLREMGIKAESITQYTGMPFEVRDLVRRVSERAAAHTERMVHA